MDQDLMTPLQKVTKELGDLPYMREEKALILSEFMQKYDLADVLEIGFFKGKSSAYFASILEAMGKGHLTTIDKSNAKRYEPTIEQTLQQVGLSHRVTPIFARRSYTWELGKMIRQSPRPQFDLCYFDGGHTWDGTGFGFCLVDLLLKPGGWIIFDDINWTIEKSIAKSGRGEIYKGYSADEMKAPAVRLVFETLVVERGYQELKRARGWGYARKPARGTAPA